MKFRVTVISAAADPSSTQFTGVTICKHFLNTWYFDKQHILDCGIQIHDCLKDVAGGARHVPIKTNPLSLSINVTAYFHAQWIKRTWGHHVGHGCSQILKPVQISVVGSLIGKPGGWLRPKIKKMMDNSTNLFTACPNLGLTVSFV